MTKGKNTKAVTPPAAETPMQQEQTMVMTIDIANIIPDDDQPRHLFDERELDDLAKSIAQYGVNSPILVRPIKGELHQYKIVFGHRRYLASKLAKKTTIPCMVKELTDKETLEIQITENLQRHDPHPMEEALAFERMQVSYSFEEIVARIGRSAKYVANRLQLCKLIDEFQQMFYWGKIEMITALKISKVVANQQMEIYEKFIDKKWKDKPNYQVYKWDIDRAISNGENGLINAKFDTNDATLYEKAGACAGCQYNSSNNLTLFIDDTSRNICQNAMCYSIKERLTYQKHVKEIVETQPKVLFVAAHTYDDSDKKAIKERLAIAEEAGGVVMDVKDLQTVEVVDKPDWDEFLDDNSNMTKPDWDEYYAERKEQFPNWEKNAKKFEQEVKAEFTKLEEEWQAECARLKIEFDDDVAHYENEFETLKKQLAEGTVREAIIIDVDGVKNSRYVVVKDETTDLQLEGKALVDDLLSKEARKKELDDEKVWQAIREVVKNGEERKKEYCNDNPLADVEQKAMYVAIYESLGYDNKNYFLNQILCLNLKSHKAEELYHLFDNLKFDQRTALVRLLMYEKLYQGYGTHTTLLTNIWGYQVAKKYYPDEIGEIETAQKEISDKRNAKLRERIDELKSKTS